MTLYNNFLPPLTLFLHKGEMGCYYGTIKQGREFMNDWNQNGKYDMSDSYMDYHMVNGSGGSGGSSDGRNGKIMLNGVLHTFHGQTKYISN